MIKFHHFNMKSASQKHILPHIYKNLYFYYFNCETFYYCEMGMAKERVRVRSQKLKLILDKTHRS